MVNVSMPIWKTRDLVTKSDTSTKSFCEKVPDVVRVSMPIWKTRGLSLQKPETLYNIGKRL